MNRASPNSPAAELGWREGTRLDRKPKIDLPHREKVRKTLFLPS
jgi:hypothetical protein